LVPLGIHRKPGQKEIDVMTAKLLDGKSLAKEIEAETAETVAQFVDQQGVQPCLAAVLVGTDPASKVYVRNKRRTCDRVGIKSQFHQLDASTSQAALLELVAQLNAAADVHGVLVQLPLPNHIQEQAVLDAIHPLKDVDAFHPENVGRLVQGRPRFLPCTPHGVMQILHRHDLSVDGKHVVILGRSEIVGKPLAIMFMQRNSALGRQAVNATVTVCHSRTQELAAEIRRADILVAAIGQAKFVKASMVKPGAVVIDVGINRTDDGLVGDVDFAEVQQVAGHLTPVPGGVGPLTVAMLMLNTLAAARLQLGQRSSES
jgi:methylenetetrahydrofolate dehydrogenase (NADP+)/methenyltetrahydrofolate cyclohydrolase